MFVLMVHEQKLLQKKNTVWFIIIDAWFTFFSLLYLFIHFLTARSEENSVTYRKSHLAETSICYHHIDAV